MVLSMLVAGIHFYRGSLCIQAMGSTQAGLPEGSQKKQQ